MPCTWVNDRTVLDTVLGGEGAASRLTHGRGRWAGVALPPSALHDQSCCCVLYREEGKKKRRNPIKSTPSVKARLMREKSELLTSETCSFSLLLFLQTSLGFSFFY